MLNSVDTDGNGSLNFYEFLNLAANFIEESKFEAEDQDLIEAFRMYDRDGNGTISGAELRHALSNNFQLLWCTDE